MKIQNKNSKAFSDVSEKVWETMQEKGMARNWKVISTEKAPDEIIKPEDLSDVEFKQTLANASAARKEGNWALAKFEYEKAYKLRELPYIKGHITSMEKKIGEIEK